MRIMPWDVIYPWIELVPEGESHENERNAPGATRTGICRNAQGARARAGGERRLEASRQVDAPRIPCWNAGENALMVPADRRTGPARSGGRREAVARKDER